MATITNLQGSTQIWNSDEIINQNFQNINNSMVEKTGNQSIAGDKTFTAVDFIHDVTNNTDNPNMRRAVKKTKVKNVWDAGGVEFVEFVDADNSIVWYRKRALRWYLKKRADWTIASYNDLFSIEYDTYDGDTTYTTKTKINTTSFRFWDQNRTGNRTSYTPTISWSSWSWTASVLIGKYKQIWKTVFVSVKMQITNKNTLSWDVNVSLPVSLNNSLYLPINWYCVPNSANPSTSSRADAELDITTVKFKKSFNTAWLQWSDITNTDWIVFNWTYEAS